MNLDNFFLKNIQTFASEMQIMYELQVVCAGKTDGVSLMVQDAIAKNKPASLLIKTLQDMARANRVAVSDVIGVNVTYKIIHHGL